MKLKRIAAAVLGACMAVCNVPATVRAEEALPKDIRWHMIGHLQRNKVKYIAKDIALIHSVDSYRLAEEINIQAKKNKKKHN